MSFTVKLAIFFNISEHIICEIIFKLLSFLIFGLDFYLWLMGVRLALQWFIYMNPYRIWIIKTIFIITRPPMSIGQRWWGKIIGGSFLCFIINMNILVQIVSILQSLIKPYAIFHKDKSNKLFHIR